jgi:glycosyltransferase involved in cell wall biosynthesis
LRSSSSGLRQLSGASARLGPKVSALEDAAGRTGAVRGRRVTPTLTVGLPVFNGARYLEASVGSILSQSFDDLELIISDNASTDETEAICRSIVGRDPRVSYMRNDENVGIAANFNRLVPLARGRLFKWATADDLLRPAYLERCVSLLDADPSVVLAYTRTDFVDEDGYPLDLSDRGWHLVSDDPSARLSEAIRADHFVNAALGVMRTNALRRTHLVPRYSGGDYRMMAELSLLGKFFEIPEPLYVRRIHHGSTKGNTGNTRWLRRYYGGARPGTRASYWRLCGDRAKVVLRAGIPSSRKVVLLAQLARSMVTKRARLVGELTELFGA